MTSFRTIALIELEPDRPIVHERLNFTERPWLRENEVLRGHDKEMTGKEKDEFNEEIIKHHNL